MRRVLALGLICLLAPLAVRGEIHPSLRHPFVMLYYVEPVDIGEIVPEKNAMELNRNNRDKANAEKVKAAIESALIPGACTFENCVLGGAKESFTDCKLVNSKFAK